MELHARCLRAKQSRTMSGLHNILTPKLPTEDQLLHRLGGGWLMGKERLFLPGGGPIRSEALGGATSLTAALHFLTFRSTPGVQVNIAKMSEKKMSSSRKHHLKSLMLAIAKDLLEQEVQEQEEERQRYMEEHCPPPSLPRTMQELQDMCRGIHHSIERIDEERYDLEMKVNKCNKEVRDLNIKIVDLRGKFKKPKLKKVRMSADAMLKALLGSKHTVNMDLRSNLKQVKKEVKEELRDVGDWRKNIEDKSDRKKMFGSTQTAKMSEKKLTSSRRHHLKSLILSIAASWLTQEKKDNIAAKEAYMAEACPPPNLSGDQATLMETCKKLQALIDRIDEERYDAEAKVAKANIEIEDLKIKVVDLAGVKKPALKKVRMSADAMLKALLGSKHTVNMDLRANLKQVKKEVKEEPLEAAGDWRKNIEDKADRKKMFETN
ncbi:unnamed protein product [Lota lota]